jgi:hypothetical protein
VRLKDAIPGAEQIRIEIEQKPVDAGNRCDGQLDLLEPTDPAIISKRFAKIDQTGTGLSIDG